MAIGALNALTIAADGLSVQRQKMNTVAENIAHAETTRTPEGGPYMRRRVVLEGADSSTSFRRELDGARLSLKRSRDGHRVGAARGFNAQPGATAVVSADVAADPPENARMIYDPSHPDADFEGFVAMPNIEVITEMVDLMNAQRAYEANLNTVEAVKSMVERALDI